MTDEKEKNGDEVEFIPQPADAAEHGAEARPPAEKGEKKESGSEAARHLKDKLKKREAEVKALKTELDELKEAHLRRLADMENLRKRFEREKAEFQQYALSGLLLELVNIADNFERALQTAPPAEGEGKTFREGVELILRMVQNLLAKQGVRPIVLDSRAFDPNFHHAMTVAESDAVEEPTVEEELQKGYLIHDRLLRPTMVKVLVPKKGQ
jgi:molecular chaperone GrpE